jgi:hypothetical protein
VRKYDTVNICKAILAVKHHEPDGYLWVVSRRYRKLDNTASNARLIKE